MATLVLNEMYFSLSYSNLKLRFYGKITKNNDLGIF